MFDLCICVHMGIFMNIFVHEYEVRGERQLSDLSIVTLSSGDMGSHIPGAYIFQLS